MGKADFDVFIKDQRVIARWSENARLCSGWRPEADLWQRTDGSLKWGRED
jgi:hypothetical protein